jgi:hypothetical protein
LLSGYLSYITYSSEMANTLDFNVNSNAVTVLNQTADAAENTAKGFTSAKAELRALNQQLLQMDASSEEFKKASARAAELKDNIGDLSAEINANAGNAFEGLSNNIGLFSSRLMSLDLKGAGQSLTAMGSAVSRIDFKTLKDEVGGLVRGLANLAGAIVGNPLLALGGAVALLVVNFDKINAALSGTAEKVEKLGEANYALEQQNSILDARINKEKTLNGESFKTLALEKEKAQNNIKVAENELAIARTTGDINTIREKENKLIEMRNLLSGITNKGEADRIKLVEEAKNITIAGYKEEQEKQAAVQKFEDARQQQMEVIAEKRRQINAALEVERLSGQEQYKTERANFIEKDIETKKVLVVSERQKKLQEDLNKLVEEEQILRNAKTAIWTNTTVNELKKEELALQKELNKEKDKGKTPEQLQKEADDKELERRKKLNEAMMAENDHMASIEVDDLIARQKKKGDTQLVTEMQIHANLTSLRAQQSQQEIEELKQAEDAKAQLRVDAMKTSLSIISDLAGAFAGESEAQQKKAFNIQKGVSIATATIDTYLAAQGAYRSQMAISTPDAPVRAAVAAGIAIAQGLARVAVISKQQFKGGGSTSGGNGGGGNVPNAGGMQAPSPANFAFVGNQPNQQPPLQAYVVSTQVSSNLEAQQLINNQARLGG